LKSEIGSVSKNNNVSYISDTNTMSFTCKLTFDLWPWKWCPSHL